MFGTINNVNVSNFTKTLMLKNIYKELLKKIQVNLNKLKCLLIVLKLHQIHFIVL